MFFHEDPGPRNQIVIFAHNAASSVGAGNVNPFANQTITWTCPSDVNFAVPMRVYVWGGGGAGGIGGGSGNGYGGGGGGLAISEFLPVADQAYTVTIAGMMQTYNGIGNTSSFAGSGITTVSASGGRSGFSNTDPTGNSTGESANPQTGLYGQGGVGVGGNIANRRGGQGGIGNLDSSNGRGGGGGSAPSPRGDRDGFRGGNGLSNQTGAGGASINYQGTDTYQSKNAGGGAGTAGPGTTSQDSDNRKSAGGCGGAGLLGSGGTGAHSASYNTVAKNHVEPGDGKGGAVWLPNQILLGGGGGGGGAATDNSSSSNACKGGCGGPGAGGGGVHTGSSGTSNSYQIAGNGGVLGGGGGGAQYCTGGNGGIAGGGGGSGYNHSEYPYNRSMHGCGGGGLVVIQYAVLV